MEPREIEKPEREDNQARARLRHDADTKAYVARRQLEGKSDKEAMRCLKRHLSNVVFRQLVVDLKGLAEAA